LRSRAHPGPPVACAARRHRHRTRCAAVLPSEDRRGHRGDRGSGGPVAGAQARASLPPVRQAGPPLARRPLGFAGRMRVPIRCVRRRRSKQMLYPTSVPYLSGPAEFGPRATCSRRPRHLPINGVVRAALRRHELSGCPRHVEQRTAKPLRECLSLAVDLE